MPNFFNVFAFKIQLPTMEPLVALGGGGGAFIADDESGRSFLGGADMLEKNYVAEKKAII